MCNIGCRYEITREGLEKGDCLFSGQNVPVDATCQILPRDEFDRVVLEAVKAKIQAELEHA